MTEVQYRGADTINYRQTDLSELKYIKIVYIDMDGEIREHKTETNYLSDDYLSLYVKKIKKEEDIEDDKVETWEEEEKQDSTSSSAYLQKLSEIKAIKEQAQITGNYDEYYKKLAEMQKPDTSPESKEEVKEAKNNEIKQEENEDITEEKESREFDIECPQEIMLKFVIGDLLYIAKSTLKQVDVKATKVYFRISAPKILELQQQRKYYRIDIKRFCLLVGVNKEGNSTAFVARSINLSAGGVLINRLESMTSNKYITINPEDYEIYHLIIVLEMDQVLKLSARYVRQEEGRKSYKYAFEFVDIPEQKTDFISKYVIRKQLEELRYEHDLKNKGIIKKHH